MDVDQRVSELIAGMQIDPAQIEAMEQLFHKNAILVAVLVEQPPADQSVRAAMQHLALKLVWAQIVQKEQAAQQPRPKIRLENVELTDLRPR